MEGVRQRGVLVDGARLRELRRSSGWTQTELAVISGISARTIRNAEAGRAIRVDFLRFLATSLGVPASELAADRSRLKEAGCEEQNVARFLQAIQAYALNHDTGLMNEILTKETFFNLPGPDTVPFFGQFRGIDGFAQMRDITDVNLRNEVPEINDIRVSGNLVVIQFKDRGHVLPTDLPYSGMVQWVLEFDDGRLKRVDNFCDTHAIVQAFYPPTRRSSPKAAAKPARTEFQPSRVTKSGAKPAPGSCEVGSRL